ncbi:MULTISPECIES: hypothetical protein [unclassified Nocardioides]|uniref:hypothetical protein n=1 Tax=unclassified Nocardioides TaxID=2615069 RepID=UPI0009F0FE8B|nr:MULTISPECIES: hypothetical protein [unclassified Nocardioides]GAW50923.1 uncharacterized protein PD653B2_3259 [Nocardioides sp. PD653-B2]GAW56350.1 uncharacterized protein PD653_3786 [Nocardioides sp. PD653]
MLHLTHHDSSDGVALTLSLRGARDEEVLRIPTPVVLETWSAGAEQVTRHEAGYEHAEWDGEVLQASCSVPVGGSAQARVRDRWSRADDDTWQVDRTLAVEGDGGPEGVRLRLRAATPFPEGGRLADFRFFAPSAVYDKNDLDEDGVDDYLPGLKMRFRDDRLNALSFTAYHEKRGVALTLIRADVPEWDELPHRPDKERLFLHDGDIGSIGYEPVDDTMPQLLLDACYPFDEGESTHALLLVERPAWEAMWPVTSEHPFEVSYQLRAEPYPDFHEAMWGSFRRRVADLRPVPVELPASLDEITRLRAESLDHYYLETDASVDPNAPAGYVLNCHPQVGEQLADIIQYGFTGQNTLNAYLMMRFGEDEWTAHGVRALDFFVDKGHLAEPGMFYDLYNAPKQKMDCWWTGLLLPLAYAEPGGDLEELMGPIYKKWEKEIPQLQQLQGSYLRCMSESAFGVLLGYELERDRGREHQEWLAAVRRYGEFLLRVQEPDGSWYRAYDHEGKPLTQPEIWFGTTPYEQKSSSSTPIPTLVKLTELTGDERFLAAAVRAGHFVRERLVDPVRFNGGIHDPIYAKGQLIDNEGILYPMLGLLELYRAVGGEYFRVGAIRAARLFATWTWLWDVPLPSTSTLAQHGFRSTGIGACDTCATGYVHPFEVIAVPELIEIAGLAEDPSMVDVAELLLHGCNQTVAVPGKDWGYASPGLQEEGYLISWWLGDDPIFEDTAFGDRGKGEGNKTCFPWIPAVAMSCYWKLVDRYGSADMEQVRSQTGMPARGGDWTGGSAAAGSR